MPRDGAELAFDRFFEKGERYTDYKMLSERDRVTRYRSNPVVFLGVQGCSGLSVDLKFDDILETTDDREVSKLDGALGRESLRRIAVKRRLLDLQCWRIFEANA